MTTGPQGTAARRADSSHIGGDRGNLYGIMVMQVTMFCFVTNDTLNKLVSDVVPTGQLMAVRGLCAVAIVLGICALQGAFGSFRHALHPMVLLRALLEAAAALFFLKALAHLPIGNVTAILLTIPLATTAAAAIFLKEEVGIRRWSAIGVGLLGVLAIVRPGLEGFNAFSLYALAAMLLASARDLITRRIPAGSSLWMVTLSTLSITTLAGGILGTSESWISLTGLQFFYLAASAIFLVGGHSLLVIAMNNGEMSVVSSFRYISILFALAYGYLLWGDLPDILTWFGISLVLLAGLYTIVRERKRALERKKAREAAV